MTDVQQLCFLAVTILLFIPSIVIFNLHVFPLMKEIELQRNIPNALIALWLSLWFPMGHRVLQLPAPTLSSKHLHGARLSFATTVLAGSLMWVTYNLWPNTNQQDEGKSGATLNLDAPVSVRR